MISNVFLTVSTNNAGPCCTFGFHQLCFPPTPKSLLLRTKARLEIVANEDVEADMEIWSNSCRNSCNQSVTREGSAENWRPLCVTTEGYKETPPPVTRNGE